MQVLNRRRYDVSFSGNTPRRNPLAVVLLFCGCFTISSHSILFQLPFFRFISKLSGCAQHTFSILPGDFLRRLIVFVNVSGCVFGKGRALLIAKYVCEIVFGHFASPLFQAMPRKTWPMLFSLLFSWVYCKRDIVK